MGGVKSTNNNLRINPSEWSYIPGYAKGAKVVRSNRGAGDGEEQVIVMNPKSNLQTELNIYNSRRNNRDALVQVLGVEPLQTTSKGMCGSQESIKVITERIPYRLAELPQMTFPEILLILNESLKGYQRCYREAGAFDVTDEMIGINNDGQVRVWVNQNFANNHPSNEKPLLQTTGKQIAGYLMEGNRDQTDMVNNIIDVIEEKCQNGRFNDNAFRDQLRQCKSFRAAQNQIQRYVEENKIWVPDHIIFDKVLVRDILNMNAHQPKRQTIERPLTQVIQPPPPQTRTTFVQPISQPIRTTFNYQQPQRTTVLYQEPPRTTYIPPVNVVPLRKSQEILRSSNVRTPIVSNVNTYAPVRVNQTSYSSYVPPSQHVTGTAGKSLIKFNYQSHI